jgi:hypothetical protein
MPKIKKGLRRLAIIANSLAYKPMSKEELKNQIAEKLNECVCNSSIEKDLFCLKIDFDAPIQYKKSNNTYIITESYNFNQHLINWLSV